MNYIIFLIIFLTSFMAAQLVIYIIHNRKRIYLKGLLGLSLCVFIYSLFYSMELVSRNINQMKMFSIIEHIGTLFISVFWVIMALEYTNKSKYIKFKLYTKISCLPVLFIIMNITDGYHHLFYKNYSITIIDSLSIVNINPGIVYILALIYINLMYLFGNILYIQHFMKNKLYKKRSCIIMVTSFFPWISSWIYVLSILPIKIDVTPIALAFVCFIYNRAISKNNIFQTAVIARHITFDNINEFILVLDMENKIIDINRKVERFFYKKARNIIGQNVAKAIRGLSEIMKFLNDDREEVFDLEIISGNKKYYFRGEITHINNDGKVVILKDNTDQVLMIKKLKYYATMDILTEVYNRNYFYSIANERISDCKENGQTVSLIMVDIDNFKCINDTYGHSAGDLVLKNIAKIFKSYLYKNCIIGRYGGEEFAIIIENLEEEKVFEIIEKIRIEIMNFNNVYEDKVIKVTSSFGIFIPMDLTDVDDMMRNADEALYQSKEDGRNRISVKINNKIVTL